MTLQDDLIRIERMLWEGGADTYRENLDTECLLVFPDMVGVSSRDEVASSVEEGERWREVELEVEGILEPAPDVALLIYRASAVRGEDETYRALVSSGYVKRGGAWNLMFHQQTPL
ncbi:MAG: nuclear transport factor 2 family protein [Thermoanaerobaculia bacterium]|nr:nuclear transport factor 2 family protein [Thermoanaerobaculia bacterium]